MASPNATDLCPIALPQEPQKRRETAILKFRNRHDVGEKWERTRVARRDLGVVRLDVSGDGYVGLEGEDVGREGGARRKLAVGAVADDLRGVGRRDGDLGGAAKAGSRVCEHVSHGV